MKHSNEHIDDHVSDTPMLLCTIPRDATVLTLMAGHARALATHFPFEQQRRLPFLSLTAKR